MQPPSLPEDRVAKPRSISVAGIHEWNAGAVRSTEDYLVGEEPLEILVNDVPLSVTMRTPGHDSELAAGFLFTEGLLRGASDIVKVEHVSDERQNGANRVRVTLAEGVEIDAESTRRNFFAASSCGICGKSSIDSVRVRTAKRLDSNLRVDPQLLCSLPDRLRSQQAIFGRTGGLHAAALFSPSGELIVVHEDVGRHNAVDKVVGWALFHNRLPLGDCILLVSGRGGFEIVQKAIVAGIPVLASVSAPSDLAVQLARELDLTLVGFLRGERFNVYAGSRRILAAQGAAAYLPA
jgi:FdhD protein